MLYNNTGDKIEDCIDLNLRVPEEFDPMKKVFDKYSNEYLSFDYDPLNPLEPPKPKISAQIPIGGAFTGKFSLSEEEIRVGAGVGIGETGYVGGFVNYDFEKGQFGLGAEAEAFGGNLKGEALAGYDWENDKLDFKLSATLFDNKIDLVHFEAKDVAHNLIGKPLDDMVNGIQGIYNHISPQAREYANFVSDLRNKADEVRDIGGLGDIIRLAGENESKMKGGEVSFQLHRATYNFLEQLDDRVSTNTRNIEINSRRIDYCEDWLKQHDIVLKDHEIKLERHENRLNQHDVILAAHSRLLACHENRLNQHEHLLNVHSKLLAVHESRLNRHEVILNNHEKRLNQHENILNLHSSILRDHEEKLHQHAMAINELYSISNIHAQILKAQGQKINELDSRMYIAENNIRYLNEKVNIHSEILSQHGEILTEQGKCINDLYKITNDQQIQLNKHDKLISEHQNAIVRLCKGYHQLNERINQDEKVINKMGEELSKVIKYSIDTRSLVEGLSQQSQIHRDLIVQNYESIKEAKTEMRNHIKIILQQQEFMKDIARQIDLQWGILERHDKEIKELKEFVIDLSKEIGNIYNEIDEIKNKLNQLEIKMGEEIAKKINYQKEKDNIEKKVNDLIEKVDDFDANKKWDFIKCMYMAINMGVYNLQQMEIVVKNISKNKT